jgi:hypothetical protein
MTDPRIDVLVAVLEAHFEEARSFGTLEHCDRYCAAVILNALDAEGWTLEKWTVEEIDEPEVPSGGPD